MVDLLAVVFDSLDFPVPLDEEDSLFLLSEASVELDVLELDEELLPFL